MTGQVLYCENGQHEWERPTQKGRPPRSCPDHPLPSAQRGAERPKINGDAPSTTEEIQSLLGDEDRRKVSYIERQIESGRRTEADVKMLTQTYTEIIDRARRTRNRNAAVR